MRVTVRLFARLRDLVGAGELVREIADEATVATVWDALVREQPSISVATRRIWILSYLDAPAQIVG